MTDFKIDGLPSVDRLHKRFSYNPETGILTRKLHGIARTIPVGSFNGRYLGIQIDRQRLMVHRVVWAMHYGEWPDAFIDHINGDGTDNRIVNLRLATKIQNGQNRGKSRVNTSGFKGVYWHKKAARWYSIGVLAGKQKYLGLYDTPEEASEAYQAFMRSTAGEFAREE